MRHPRPILRQRLLNQGLAGTRFRDIESTVRWLGAIQAQEYAVAKWSIGQRASGVSDSDVDRALENGTLIRTHILRPTWHFVAAADIRWMLALSAPRVHQVNGHMYRTHGLTDRLHAKCHTIMRQALSGNRTMTRTDLAGALAQGGVKAAGQKLAYIVMHAELEGLLCSGGHIGKQRTYALLDERVPPAPPRDRDGALLELVTRYFVSRGPASVDDFSWWSGLTKSDTRRGIEMADDTLESVTIDGVRCWHAANPRKGRIGSSPTFHLLQGYDEYVVAYRDTRKAFDEKGLSNTTPIGQAPFLNTLILDGSYFGSWQRRVGTTAMALDVEVVRRVDRREVAALEAAVQRYGRFVRLPTTLELHQP